MALLNVWGGVFGYPPLTGGRMFFVGPASSSVSTVTVNGNAYPLSDGNDGLSPEKPLATINRAIALATANVGDIICLFPGTHNASSMTGQTASGNIAVSKAGLTFVGLPMDITSSKTYAGVRPQAIITAPAATIPVSVTVADTAFINIGFQEVSGKRTLDYTTAADRLTVRGCHFNMNVGAASTVGLAPTGATQAPSNMMVEDCIFEHDNTGTSDSYALDVGAGVGFIVRNNTFRHRAQGAGVAAWTTAIKVNDNANGLFDGNRIYSLNSGAATITNGISGVSMTGTGVIRMYNNLVGAIVTNPFTGFAASDADLLNNYIGTVAAGTGGTLITSTT